MKNRRLKQILLFTLALAVSSFAQETARVKVSDSLGITKKFENLNLFQLDKWGPVTYEGKGKCDILDLYHESASQNLGYAAIVDYHYKQTKKNGKYSCKSWGLGLAYKVIPDVDKYSKDYDLGPGKKTKFSAQRIDQINKAFSLDSSFLEIESITPVTYKTTGKCYTYDFLSKVAHEKSGYHGIIDIKYHESTYGDDEKCTFWGLAVKYKRRSVVEKVVEKRSEPKVEAPSESDPLLVPIPIPRQNKPASTKNCCMPCCCCND